MAWRHPFLPGSITDWSSAFKVQPEGRDQALPGFNRILGRGHRDGLSSLVVRLLRANRAAGRAEFRNPAKLAVAIETCRLRTSGCLALFVAAAYKY
jgi:hypothetical protein